MFYTMMCVTLWRRKFIIRLVIWGHGCRDSSVGTATRYVLDGPGIESRWETKFSAPVQTGSGANPASCTMGTGSFPAAWCWSPHPNPQCRGLKLGRAIPLPALRALVACYRGNIYLYLYGVIILSDCSSYNSYSVVCMGGRLSGLR